MVEVRDAQRVDLDAGGEAIASVALVSAAAVTSVASTDCALPSASSSISISSLRWCYALGRYHGGRSSIQLNPF